VWIDDGKKEKKMGFNKQKMGRGSGGERAKGGYCDLRV
jgi:hypothetical protein